MTHYGFYHNADACAGCKACVIACKDKNNLPLGKKFRRVYDYAGGTWSVDNKGVCSQQNGFVYSISVSCMHCASPACVANCPAGAMTQREDGIVFVDRNLCIACGTCEKSCPYGQPSVDQDNGYSTKCDLCRLLIDKGENPACVDACATRALHYGDIEELKKQYGSVTYLPPLPENDETGPSIVFTPSRLNPDGTLPGSIINPEEEIL